MDDSDELHATTALFLGRSTSEEYISYFKKAYESVRREVLCNIRHIYENS
jgi:hypothetical protein